MVTAGTSRIVSTNPIGLGFVALYSAVVDRLVISDLLDAGEEGGRVLAAGWMFPMGAVGCRV